MSKTTIIDICGLTLLLSGIVLASAEPICWLLPVGLLIAFAGCWLLLYTQRKEVKK